MAALEEQRQDRERDFHNRKYAQEAPPPTLKYYASNRRCVAEYNERLLRGAASKRILEYGCGEGSAAYDLAAAGARVTGIDISDVAIANARAEADRRGVDVDFRVMDAEHLDFPDATFDAICGSAILHHLELDPAAAEIARCLAPGGEAVFLEPLGHNPLINAYRRLTPALRTPDEHPLRVSDFETFTTHFGAVDVRYYALTTLAAVPFRARRFFPKLLGSLERLDEVVTRRVPASRKYAWYSLLVLADPIAA